MLRIIQSTNSAATKNYYSKSDYYVTGQEQELVGHWGGRGAEALGLRGEVDKDAFDALCDNINPNTGERLTLRMNDNRRVGWDFNLHVPKSLSVIYGRSQDERILDVVRQTGEDVMALMEAEVRTRVRAAGRNETKTIGNWAYGEFVHFTARPVDGVADPHLHLHCFVFNAGLDPEEGWKALDIGGIKRDAPYFQAVFHSLLAERIAELGYGVRRTRQGWELDGVPDSVIAKFSRRTDEIEKLAAELGLKAGAEKDALGAKTRKRKCKEMTMDELRAAWEERLDDDERAALDRVAEGGVGGIPDVTADQALDYAIRHCMARDSAVTERQLVSTALRYGVGAVTAEEVRERFDDHGVITGFIDGELHASTRDVLAEERFLASFARDGKNTCVPLGETKRPFSRDWLNAGQRAAVRHMLESQDRVIAVRGLAGVGKTTSLSEAREGIEEGGHELFVFANSSDASRGVLRAEGFEEADTIASLLNNEKLQQRIQGQVILIDEISQVGTRTLARVFDLADELDARVILVGDEKQHGAVERGDVMRVLREQAGIVPVEVRDILRQKGAYKAAIQALADGRAQEGFDRLDALEWITAIPDGEREQALAVAYADGVEAGKNMLAVSPTHREKDRVTEAIRQELKARGLIGEEDREFVQLESINLTDAERADAVNLRRTMATSWCQFHQNAKAGGFKEGAGRRKAHQRGGRRRGASAAPCRAFRGVPRAHAAARRGGPDTHHRQRNHQRWKSPPQQRRGIRRGRIYGRGRHHSRQRLDRRQGIRVPQPRDGEDQPGIAGPNGGGRGDGRPIGGLGGSDHDAAVLCHKFPCEAARADLHRRQGGPAPAGRGGPQVGTQGGWAHGVVADSGRPGRRSRPAAGDRPSRAAHEGPGGRPGCSGAGHGDRQSTGDRL